MPFLCPPALRVMCKSDVQQFLRFLVDLLRRTSPDLLQRLRYGDDGKGAEKMAQLQVLAVCNSRSDSGMDCMDTFAD